MHTNVTFKRSVSLLLGGAVLLASATANASDLEHRLTVYGWLPAVSGKTVFPDDGDNVEVDTGDILGAINMVFMGSYEVRNGGWSLLTDLIYLDLGNKDNSRVTLPGDRTIITSVREDLSGWQVGLYAGHEMFRTVHAQMSVVAGLRFLSLEAKAELAVQSQLPPLTLEDSTDVWDGVVGLRGQYRVNPNWYIPYHFDVGAGNSDLTWQAMVGIGYRTKWGEFSVNYRHLQWDQGDNRLLQSLGFSGPGIAATFHF